MTYDGLILEHSKCYINGNGAPDIWLCSTIILLFSTSNATALPQHAPVIPLASAHRHHPENTQHFEFQSV